MFIICQFYIIYRVSYLVMMPIREMYNVAKHSTNHGIEGYKVEKKYLNSQEHTGTELKKK